MPNWCGNQIKISGDRVTAIAKILKDNQGGKMFELLVGRVPDGMTEDDYQNNWYDINCNRWGCKWDVDISLDDMSFGDDEIYMYIQTAWSSCNDFLRLLNIKYCVDVENIFSEGGNDFAGRFMIEDGNESYECYTYLRGLYEFDYDSFLFEARDQLEYMVGDDTPPTLEEWINEFPFVEDEYVKENLIELYNEIIKQ
jgi:hypothetical protein